MSAALASYAPVNIPTRVLRRRAFSAQRGINAQRPWLRIRTTRAFTEVHLTVPVSPGHYQTFSVKISNEMVRRALMKRGIHLQIGFSLGGIWKGIKKVAKATGVSAVLNVASKVLKNPIVSSVFPVASIAARAVEAGTGLLNAATAAKHGSPKAKKVAKAMIAKAAKAAKAGNPVAQSALTLASRAYKITVTPLG